MSILTDRPWWMAAIDEPVAGGLLRSTKFPRFGLMNTSAASGGAVWVLGINILGTDTTLAKS